MNGNTRANIALAGAMAAILTPYAEKKYHIAISADDVMAGGALAFAAWHAVVAAAGPYAKRIFDHYFPPVPGDAEYTITHDHQVEALYEIPLSKPASPPAQPGEQK